jgi:hypothetical protein
MSILTHPIALLAAAATSFAPSRRYEDLFSLSEAELERRGLNRDGLVRGYIAGLTRG